MLQRKIQKNSSYFKPYPFVLKKDRRHGLIVESNPINWSELNEEEVESQWGYCLNCLWFYEKEGIITRDNLKQPFTSFMKSRGYTENDIKLWKSAPDWMTATTHYSVAYLIMSGVKKDNSENWLKKKIDEILLFVKEKAQEEKQAVKEKVIEKPRKTIQEAMAEKLSEIIGEIQGMEDEMLKVKPDFMTWFRNRNIAKNHMDDIGKYFAPRLKELEEVLEGEDEQLVEGYSRLSKSEIKKMIAWYQSLLTDVDAYSRLKIATRKIRARKPKSPAKLVSRLKYLRHSDDLKIQSINSEKIIGSDTLWVYNVKYKRLIMYIASEIDGELSVKGSTIIGWDPKASYGKTLRKPEEQLKELMNGGKVAMRNLLKSIKGKDKMLNGRLNKDCLLLKAF